MADHLLIEDGGLLSTVQDLGRFGYQRFGISASGAMDPVSMQIANALVGNPLETAALEVTMLGPTFTVEAEACRIAFAGGDFGLTVNGAAAETYRGIDLGRGDRVKIGAARSGMRGYLAIAGGLAIEPVLGSLSTHTRSSIGGLEGRALRSGDRIPLRPRPQAGLLLHLPASHRPSVKGEIRVMLGPQDDAFTPEGIETFLSSAYVVSAKTDRMGCQLEGPAIGHKSGFNIISDGIMNGSIQVPGEGRPFVLLADRQTTGGYPKIATVIGPDLPKLAHRRPGEEIRFRSISAEEAGRVAIEARDRLRRMLSQIRPAPAGAAGASAESLMSANLISGVSAGHESAEQP